MLNVCTVITPDYLYKALALLYSMIPFQAVTLHCLVSEERHNIEGFRKSISAGDSRIIFYGLDDIYDQRKLHALPRDNDRLRWTSKSRFMIHLLETANISRLVYLDSDICFFNDFRFLFDELKKSILLLTPHWRPIYPGVNEMQFSYNFRDGLYNAGFLGANDQGLDALNWWHKACLYKCEFDFENGFYVDQKYLDALPVYFDEVKIIKHLGCNIAEWNSDFLKREEVDGRILINGEWPIIFMHFTGMTIADIENGRDKILKSQLSTYRSCIEKANAMITKLKL